jgi:LmbE family N-acetylglucosaminyl deacetylase
MMNRLVLVVAAHADDEALGCGATMARHAAAGDRVETMFMTDGVGARGQTASAIASRRRAAETASAALGAAAPVFGDFPDNQMDTVALLRIAGAVEAFVGGRSPDLVYTHHSGDLNIDHRLTAAAVMTCFRPQPGRPRPVILGFEVPSSTEWQSPAAHLAFLPNWFEDASATIEAKRRALACYAEEMRPWPHSRSIEAVENLARYRGSTVGLEAAEAFMLYRRIG